MNTILPFVMSKNVGIFDVGANRTDYTMFGNVTYEMFSGSLDNFRPPTFLLHHPLRNNHQNGKTCPRNPA